MKITNDVYSDNHPNPAEAKFFSESDWVDRLAAALLSGISEWVERPPPEPSNPTLELWLNPLVKLLKYLQEYVLQSILRSCLIIFSFRDGVKDYFPKAYSQAYAAEWADRLKPYSVRMSPTAFHEDSFREIEQFVSVWSIKVTLTSPPLHESPHPAQRPTGEESLGHKDNPAVPRDFTESLAFSLSSLRGSRDSPSTPGSPISFVRPGSSVSNWSRDSFPNSDIVFAQNPGGISPVDTISSPNSNRGSDKGSRTSSSHDFGEY